MATHINYALTSFGSLLYLVYVVLAHSYANTIRDPVIFALGQVYISAVALSLAAVAYRNTKWIVGRHFRFNVMLSSAASVCQLMLFLFPDTLEWDQMIKQCDDLQDLVGLPMTWAQPCPKDCVKTHLLTAQVQGRCVTFQNATQTSVVYEYRGVLSTFGTITTVLTLLANGVPVWLSSQDRNIYHRHFNGSYTLHRLLGVNVVAWLA